MTLQKSSISNQNVRRRFFVIEMMKLSESSNVQWLHKEIPVEILETLELLYSETITKGLIDDPEDSTWILAHANENEYHRSIANYSHQLLNSHGFYVKELDHDNVIIECHEYRINGPHQPEFTMHTDDYGAIYDGRVNTILYYLQKDSTIIGGDLLIYPNAQLEYNIPIPNTDITTCHRVNVCANTMLLLRGDLAHEVEHMNGIGLRRCIVVQMYRE
jgi:hypothetical protein